VPAGAIWPSVASVHLLRRRLVLSILSERQGSRADLGKFIADQIEKWVKVIKFAGIKPD
jgi:hypothetical protein